MFDISYLYQQCIIISVKGATLVLVIVCLQHFFKKDFTSHWIYILWILAILRLLLPTTPLVNVLSIYNLGLYKRLTFDAHELILGRMSILNDHLFLGGNSYTISSFIQQAFAFNWTEFLSRLWFIGMGIFTLIFGYLNIAFYIYTKKGILCTDPQILEQLDKCLLKATLRKAPDIYMVDHIQSPMAYGILKPRILIPIDMLDYLDYNQIRYIILHEIIHIKRRDILYNFLSMLACIIHWFNPFAWYIFFHSKKACELACDEKVLNLLSDGEYQQYGHTLIEVIEQNSTHIPHPIMNKAFINNRSEANSRILQISRFQQKRKSIIILSTLFLLLVGLLGFNEDSSMRPSMAYNKVALGDYLDQNVGQIRSSLAIQPIQTYMLRTNNSSHFILYYNIMGIPVQFWYDGITTDHNRRTLDITTTSYKNITQGMDIDRAIDVANQQFDTFVTHYEKGDFIEYIYGESDYHVMLLGDIPSNKIYSITLYRGEYE